ncbi:hypothetical protein BH18THE2_BH18THE2_31600 [soil metagenome]
MILIIRKKLAFLMIISAIFSAPVFSLQFNQQLVFATPTSEEGEGGSIYISSSRDL